MHECPDCASGCYCGGDIDDMLMNGTPEEACCDHWRKCQPCDMEEYGDECLVEIEGWPV
jgi:hypothetical protein